MPDDDALPTTRMPTLQPPPLPAFSPQQIYASLHDGPREKAKEKERSASWDTKPGSWWPSVKQEKRTTERPVSAPTVSSVRWTQAEVGILTSVAGAAIVVVALIEAALDLAFPYGTVRDALTITIVISRLVVALAFAAFGWGLIRLGERLALR